MLLFIFNLDAGLPNLYLAMGITDKKITLKFSFYQCAYYIV